ncbi:MAG: VOC family protein [Bacteriovoracaceae bacterium]
MLKTFNPTSTIAVKNMRVAKDFYEKKLGLTPTGTGNDDVQLYQVGNGMIELYKSDFAGSNKATVLTWEVGDKIDNEVNELKSKGISFEHYQIPDTKLQGDIHVMRNMKAAWFKDPDGNILCLHDH